MNGSLQKRNEFFKSRVFGCVGQPVGPSEQTLYPFCWSFRILSRIRLWSNWTRQRNRVWALCFHLHKCSSSSSFVCLWHRTSSWFILRAWSPREIWCWSAFQLHQTDTYAYWLHRGPHHQPDAQDLLHHLSFATLSTELVHRTVLGDHIRGLLCLLPERHEHLDRQTAHLQ